MTSNTSSEAQGKSATASQLDLVRRIAALETQINQQQEDVRRYTEHCIRLMQASTELAKLMQEYGIDTRSAAKLLDKSSAH